MASPFTHITLDGTRLAGEAALAWADELIKQDRNGTWANDLRSTLKDLITGDGSLHTHTSGTTGAPKSVIIPPRDLQASARLTAQVFELHAGDRVLLCLPCEFIGGKMMVVRAMALGLDLHAIDPRGGVLRNLRVRDRFRFAAMVPMQLHTALQHDRARVEEQFETILLGGGPVSQALIERCAGLRTRVVVGYGSTEMVTHVALGDLNGASAADHYTALGEVTFALDARSCLVVRTPHLSVLEQTTNDIVELIDDRHFRWLGRHDHVILSGGRKIHPERLEAMTAGVIPYPHFFAAVPDERLGQSVALFLETGNDSGKVPADALHGSDGVLYEHERPRRVIALREFLRTASGKIERIRTLAEFLK
jgi:o-succinylbenzoate---CoA ligase